MCIAARLLAGSSSNGDEKQSLVLSSPGRHYGLHAVWVERADTQMLGAQEVQAAEVKLATLEEQAGQAEAQAAELQLGNEQLQAAQAEAARHKEAAAGELEAVQAELTHAVRKLEVRRVLFGMQRHSLHLESFRAGYPEIPPCYLF